MEFQESYFENEVRDGFFVTSMMKRSWAAQLEILEDIDKVCRKYGISYYADAGTLLGAVRHQGFIPWDDDLDLCMMRNDYNRFISIAQKALPKGYLVRNIHTDSTYTEMFTRVLNSREINFQTDFLTKFHGCPYGMGIDIFVMDYIPSSTEEMDFLHLVLNSIDDIITEIDEQKLTGKELDDRINLIESMLRVKLDPSQPLINQLLLLKEKLFSLYTENESSEVTVMPVWIRNEKFKWQKWWFDEKCNLVFENIMVPAPFMYDAILRKKYGNYMDGVKSGATHDYPLFRKQEIALTEKLGNNPYTYVISAEDIHCTTRVKTITLKKQVKYHLYLLEKNHNHIKELESDTSEILDMLKQCQTIAISLGTLVEKEVREESRIVRKLENYCELIYKLYECAVQNGFIESENIWNHLDDQLKQIKNDVKVEVDLKREILFLPYKASLWEYFESIWRAAEVDTECVSYVMPIPYFYKMPDGGAGILHYEAEEFPEYVPIVKYDEFDFNEHCFDSIYIQNPYDEYDTALSVHPFFYSNNIKKYTDNLVYIPSFVVDEITSKDDRAISNIYHCCVAPGVVHADKVFVQSEEMRKVYIDLLNDCIQNVPKTFWERKIVGFGSPKIDRHIETEKEDKELPVEWMNIIKKSDGSSKKIVMYGTNTGYLLYYGNEMLKKINGVLALFKKNSEHIALIWVPYGVDSQMMKVKNFEIWERYKKLLMEYKDQGWGILELSCDLDRAVSLCDAYYGDRGYTAQMCKERNIPVMIQNVE